MTSLVPVMPKGWPSAIAPPFTLRISGLISPMGSVLFNSSLANSLDGKARRLAMTWAANASFISINSMSFKLIPVLSKSLEVWTPAIRNIDYREVSFVDNGDGSETVAVEFLDPLQSQALHYVRIIGEPRS